MCTYDDRVMSKDEIFGKYYSKTQQLPEQPSDGYVKAQIQVTIPKISNMSLHDNMSSISGDISINSPNTPGGSSGGHPVQHNSSPYRMDGSGASTHPPSVAASLMQHDTSPNTPISHGLPTFPDTTAHDITKLENPYSNISHAATIAAAATLANAPNIQQPPPSVQSSTHHSDNMETGNAAQLPQGFQMDDFNSSPIDVNELLSKTLN